MPTKRRDRFLKLERARPGFPLDEQAFTQATRELMLDFYRRVWVERVPKAQALWDAKCRLREAVDASGNFFFSEDNVNGSVRKVAGGI